MVRNQTGFIYCDCIRPASGHTRQQYADDSYLIVPASNTESCPAEIANVESWADNNRLKLNRIKSAEIVFVRPRSRVAVSIPPAAYRAKI